MAFLTKNLRIQLKDDREEKREDSFHYEGGIREFVSYLNRSNQPLYEQIIYCEGTRDDVYVEVAMQHNDSYTESTYGFVNNITTPEGRYTYCRFSKCPDQDIQCLRKEKQAHQGE